MYIFILDINMARMALARRVIVTIKASFMDIV
jgi:hypothetical protein